MNPQDLKELEALVWELVDVSYQSGKLSCLSKGNDELIMLRDKLSIKVEDAFLGGRTVVAAQPIKTAEPSLLYSILVDEAHLMRILRFFRSNKRKEGIFFEVEEFTSKNYRIKIFKE